MAGAFVQSAFNSNVTSADLDVTVSTPGAGGLILAFVGSATDAMTFTSVTLNPGASGQAFTALFESEGGAHTAPIGIYYLANASAAGTTVRLVKSAAAHCVVHEYSGMATASVTDGSVASSVDQADPAGVGSGSTHPSSGNVTTTNANDLLVGWIEMDASTLTNPLTTPLLGGSAATQPANSETARLAAFYRFVSATGNYAAQCDWAAPDAIYSLCAAAFQQAAAAGQVGRILESRILRGGLIKGGTHVRS